MKSTCRALKSIIIKPGKIYFLTYCNNFCEVIKIKQSEEINSEENNNEELKNSIDNYKQTRVWVTKKVRMDAEAIRKRVNNHLEILLTYYSVATLSLSVITYKNPDENLDTWNLLITIFLLGIVIIVTNLNLDNKANEFKKSYILLDQLEAKIDKLIFNINHNSAEITFHIANDAFFNIKEEYSKILNETDNHSDFDFLSYRVSRFPKELSCHDFISYHSKKIFYYTIIVIVFILPIFILTKKLL
ncbi:MAG: SLATT domain-containing protein [Carnobacterium sp.]|uniref:SLATT domain-containing protein n=1 Tax=Carnobacterium sp. TaxID=48221 RepID=UPI003C70A9D6